MSKHKVREQQIPMPSVYPLNIGSDYQFIRYDFYYLFFSHIACTLFYMVLGFVFFRIICGQKIVGRKNLRSLKNRGFISIANHCHLFDTFMTAVALFPRRPWFAAVQRNFEAPYFRKMFRILRGFPIPDKTLGLKMILKPVIDGVNKKKIIHFFPEEELWHLCQQIDYFQRGAFYLAHKANCPVLPIIHLFRTRTIFGKKISPEWIKVKTVIGEPIYPEIISPGSKGTDKNSVERMSQKAQEWMEQIMNEYKQTYKESITESPPTINTHTE